MKNRHLTYALVGLTLRMLLISVPRSLHQAQERHGFYLSSWAFIEKIPRRTTRPGRFRFIFQPLRAIITGILTGGSDARTGCCPFMPAVMLQPELRSEAIMYALNAVLSILLVGFLLDTIHQWARDGYLYPGAALVGVSVLILESYLIASDLASRIARSTEFGKV